MTTLARAVVASTAVVAEDAIVGPATRVWHFAQIRGALTSGTLDRSGLDRELEALHAEAQTADASIQKAVIDLRAAGAPGTSAFLVARTALADTCDRLRNRTAQ